MKRHTSIAGLVCLAAALCITAAASTADAAYMKWCTRWRSQYTDGGIGEDLFTSTNVVYRTAKYNSAEVWNQATSTRIWYGELDSSGCTPYLAVSSYTQYKFRQATKVKKDNRTIYVNPDSGTWGASYIWLNSYYTTGNLYWLYGYTHTFSPNWNSPKGNLMPLSRRVLAVYTKLDYPLNTLTYIRTDNTHCDSSGGAFYQSGTNNICLQGQDADGWEDITKWKFIFGHEMGHRVADANGGPDCYGYTEQTPVATQSHCTCDHVDDYGSDLHCMGSREKIGTAQCEGFAHFFSAAVFNDNDNMYGILGYPKEAWVFTGENYYVDTTPPVAFNAVSYKRWMENECDPGNADKGTEHDWMSYFWNVWADGSYESTIDEINDVFDNADSSTYGIKWTDMMDSVEDKYDYGTGDYYQWLNNGDSAGVDHES